jgi:pimeloyl-ACP methyl ester carboxylesterase
MQLIPATGEWRRSALRILSTLLVFYLALCALLYWRQTRFIFFPNQAIVLTPAAFGCEKFEEVRFGEHKLHGWWMPGKRPLVLIYHHGNAGNISDNSEHACRLNKMGFSVFIFDYRGYGLSDGGFPSEKSVYEDAEAAWDLVRTRAGLQPVLLYGHSLGGAVATEMARRHPEAAGLIMESSFSSVYEMASRDRLFRLFPVRLILDQHFDSASKLREITIPKLFIHGSADRVVPAEMTERLYRTAREPKRLVFIAGGGHDNSAATDEDGYRRAVLNFVENLSLHKVAATR